MLAAWLGAACAVAGTEWTLDAAASCPTVTPFRVVSSGFSLASSDYGILPTIDGGFRSSEPAVPDVPFLVRLLPLPSTCDLEVVARVVDCVETNSPLIAPVASGHVVEEMGGARLATARTKLGEVYSRDAFWPANVADVRIAAQGTQRWARVAIYPVQVNPVTRQVRWNRVIEGELIFKSGQ